MSAWRFRMCPNCREVFAAGKLRQIDYGARWHERGSSRCACPSCGHRAPRYQFRVIRDERRTEVRT